MNIVTIKRGILASPLFVAGLALVTPLLAAAGTPVAPSSLPGGFQTANRFLALLLTITNFLFALFIGLAILLLLWAAFLYLTARGEEDQLDKAKKTIMGAVIALVIAFLANGIPTLIQVFIGV